MSTVIKTQAETAVPFVETRLKIMERAQHCNTQPKPIVYVAPANGAAKPVAQSLEAILKMMEMAQKRNLQQA